ncbi:MAG: hypothetical protein O2800_06415 [Planctomycetota bacterium]|nr:hypothetical protein [Planctomycetota bacterium]
MQDRRFAFARVLCRVVLAASVMCATLLMPLLTGCNVYQNFPTDDPKAFVDPYFPPMPDIMAKAIKFTHQRVAPTQPLVWNLPSGARSVVWEKVAQVLPTDARPMRKDDVDSFSIRQVRVSGAKAQVDVVYHGADGLWRLVTVYLKKVGPLQMFQPDYLQSWNIPTDAPTANDPSAAG